MSEVNIIAHGNISNLKSLQQKMKPLFDMLEKLKLIEDELNKGSTGDSKIYLQIQDPKTIQLGRDFVSEVVDSGMKFHLQDRDDEFNSGDKYFYGELARGIEIVKSNKKQIKIEIFTTGYFHRGHERFIKEYLLYCGCENVKTHTDSDEW